MFRHKERLFPDCCKSVRMTPSVAAPANFSAERTPPPLLAVRPVAFPLVPRVIDVRVFRDVQCDAELGNRPVPSVALPAGAVRRRRQVCVRRHPDGYAGFIDCVKPTRAFPGIATLRSQVRVLGYTNSDTRIIALQITATALPATSVSAVCRVGIVRQLGARAVDFAITAITNPSVGVMRGARVFGQIDGVPLGVRVNRSKQQGSEQRDSLRERAT